MIGSFLTRALALVFGYAYPAYECFKTVELNRPEIEQLRFWCQYWILVAALTVFERVGDTFISWMPMYSEAKVAFFVYLWHPKTRGTTYIYENFLQPYVASRETDIDRNLLELKARAGDMVFLYWQKAANFGQSRILEVFQYIASQSPQQQTRSKPTMRQPANLSHQAAAPVSVSNQPDASTAADNQAAAIQKLIRPPPPSPVKNKSQEPAKPVGGPPAAPPTQIQPSSGPSAQPAVPVAASQSSTSEGEAKQIAAAEIVIAAEVSNPAAHEETPIEEAIRMTRGRLRKRAGPFGQSTR